MNKLNTFLAVTLAFAFASTAGAADWTTAIAAVDFADVILAIVGVIGAVAGVIVVMKGGKMLLSSIR